MSKNSRGTFISMAYAGDDYLRDGELMFANMTEYRLTPNLGVGLAGNIGQFNSIKAITYAAGSSMLLPVGHPLMRTSKTSTPLGDVRAWLVV